jgi:Cys-rich protein (TIGR01571 family)
MSDADLEASKQQAAKDELDEKVAEIQSEIDRRKNAAEVEASKELRHGKNDVDESSNHSSGVDYTHMTMAQLQQVLKEAEEEKQTETIEALKAEISRRSSSDLAQSQQIEERRESIKEQQLDAAIASGTPVDSNPVAEVLGDRAEGAVVEDSSEVEQEVDDIIVDIEEIERVTAKVLGKIKRLYDQEGVRHIVLNTVVYFSAVFIALGLYAMCFRHREVAPNQEWRYGICECLGDTRVCACGLCCPAIRWADTVSEEKGGFFSYTSALFVMMGLGMMLVTPMLGLCAWTAIVAIGVYFRQKIRLKYGLETDTPLSYIEDTFIWCCCAWCAICQEARQVDEEITVEEHAAESDPKPSRAMSTSW